MHAEDLPPEIELGLREMAEAIASVTSTAELVVGAAELVGGLPFALLPVEVADSVLDIVAAGGAGDDLLAALAFAAGPPLAGVAAARLAGSVGHGRALDLAQGRLREALVVDHVGETARIVVGVIGFAVEAEGVVVTALVDGTGLRGGIGDGSVGLLDDAVRDLQPLREGLAEDGGIVRDLAPAEAVALVRDALAANREVGVAPPPSAVSAAAILLGAAEPGAVRDLDGLMGLPMLPDAGLADPEEDEEEPDEAELEQVEERLDAIASDYSDAVGEEAGEDASEIAWEVASQLDAFAVHDAVLPDPTRWTRDLVRVFLLDWAPAEGPFSPDLPVAPALAGYLRYLGDRDEIAPPIAEALARYAENLDDASRLACADRSRWSPGKALTAAMLEDDVDLEDEDAVAAWMDDFNALPDEERARILEGR